MAAFLLAASPLHAGELSAMAAESIHIGGFRSVLYYTHENDGYRVVATLAEGEAGVPCASRPRSPKGSQQRYPCRGNWAHLAKTSRFRAQAKADRHRSGGDIQPENQRLPSKWPYRIAGARHACIRASASRQFSIKEVISMNKTNLGVALVTGASSGIGHATAKALQNAGFRVFGTSRRVAAERSDGVTMLACDVTDDGLLRNWSRRCWPRLGASTCSSTMPASGCSAAQRNPRWPRLRRCST